MEPLRGRDGIAQILISSLLALALCACGLIPSLGDQSRTITLRNTAGEALDVYTYQHDPVYRVRLQPAQTFSQGWMFPISADDQRVRRVEADDLSGRRVFCLDLKYDELARRNWRIEIDRSNTCVDAVR